MENFLFKICYNGSNYHGFQIQKNVNTVEKQLKKALKLITKQNCDIEYCSRTDAKVHANEFYFNSKFQSVIPPKKFIRVLNNALPADILVLDCKKVDFNFHSRYNSKQKQYLYRIYDSDVRNPFYKNYALYSPNKLDVKLLNKAAKEFIGTYDFVGFSTKGSQVKTTVKTITDFYVERNQNFVEFYITGNSFLYNMVRIIIGTMLDVNRGKIKIQDIKNVINSKDRNNKGKTAEPQGLYLNKVTFKEVNYE